MISASFTTRWARQARPASWLLPMLGALALLVGCGGGGGDPPAGSATPSPVPPVATPPATVPPTTAPPTAAPPAVTQALPPEGGVVVAALAGGAQATLRFPSTSHAVPMSVTVTPLAPATGEWARFSFAPAADTLGAPVKLLVRPPEGVNASQVPVLQLLTADGPTPLRTRALAERELQAELPPLLARLEGDARTTAAPGRVQALSAAGRLAWKAIDYGWIEVQFDPFRRGVRRLLALCAAAREIEAELACPRSADFP